MAPLRQVTADRMHQQGGGVFVGNVAEGATVNVTVNVINYLDGLPQSQNPELKKLFEESSQFQSNHEYKKAIDGFNKCLALEDDHTKRGALNLQIGNCYYDLQQYLKAADYYSSGLRESHRGNAAEGVAASQVNIASTYMLRKAQTAAYRGQNVQAAVQHYRAALEIYKKDEYPQNYCQTAANMGLLLAEVDRQKACYWLKEAYSLRTYLEDQGKRLEEVMDEVCKD